MELMGDGLIAFLAAVGVSTILWLLAETLCTVIGRWRRLYWCCRSGATGPRWSGLCA